MLKGYYVVKNRGIYEVEEDEFESEEDFMECQRRIFSTELYLGRYYFLTRSKRMAITECARANKELELKERYQEVH